MLNKKIEIIIFLFLNNADTNADTDLIEFMSVIKKKTSFDQAFIANLPFITSCISLINTIHIKLIKDIVT